MDILLDAEVNAYGECLTYVRFLISLNEQTHWHAVAAVGLVDVVYVVEAIGAKGTKDEVAYVVDGGALEDPA